MQYNTIQGHEPGTNDRESKIIVVNLAVVYVYFGIHSNSCNTIRNCVNTCPYFIRSYRPKHAGKLWDNKRGDSTQFIAFEMNHFAGSWKLDTKKKGKWKYRMVLTKFRLIMTWFSKLRERLTLVSDFLTERDRREHWVIKWGLNKRKKCTRVNKHQSIIVGRLTSPGLEWF